MVAIDICAVFTFQVSSLQIMICWFLFGPQTGCTVIGRQGGVTRSVTTSITQCPVVLSILYHGKNANGLISFIRLELQFTSSNLLRDYNKLALIITCTITLVMWKSLASRVREKPGEWKSSKNLPLNGTKRWHSTVSGSPHWTNRECDIHTYNTYTTFVFTTTQFRSGQKNTLYGTIYTNTITHLDRFSIANSPTSRLSSLSSLA